MSPAPSNAPAAQPPASPGAPRWRSLLYTPADRPERYTKAWAAGAADIVCADLEDAVAPERRPDARAMAAKAVASVLPALGTRRAVRINPWPGAEADLDAVAPARPELVVLPKAESARDVEAVVRRMRELLPDQALPGLVAILETPRGVLAAPDVLAAPGVVAACFGAEDLAAAMGLRRSAGNEEVRTARQWVALAAAAAGVPAIDMITADLGDLDRCAREAAEARAWGYAGKMCIHPGQVAPIHAAFQPTPEEVAWAEEVAAAARGIANGGVAVVRGQMVDVPVIRRAERILAARG